MFAADAQVGADVKVAAAGCWRGGGGMSQALKQKKYIFVSFCHGAHFKQPGLKVVFNTPEGDKEEKQEVTRFCSHSSPPTTRLLFSAFPADDLQPLIKSQALLKVSAFQKAVFSRR